MPKYHGDTTELSDPMDSVFFVQRQKTPYFAVPLIGGWMDGWMMLLERDR